MASIVSDRESIQSSGSPRGNAAGLEHMMDHVEISSWKIKTGPNDEQFAVYHVSVELASGLQWAIEKRYKQFRALRREVQECVPELADYAFPGKNYLAMFNLSDGTLKYRSETLTNYLNALIAADPEMSELVNFLQVVNNVSLLTKRVPSSKNHRSGSICEDFPPNVNDFKFLRIIGQGSFGKVYLVKPESAPITEVYAMKVLNKADVVRRHQVEHTKTEREIMATASHPFIVSLRFSFQTDDKLYMITEYCPGGELYFHLKKMKTFSINMVQFYAAQIAMAMEYLHRKNIIYRDLKPENVLLDRDGNCKLTDFGLSKVIVPFPVEDEFDSPTSTSDTKGSDGIDWYIKGPKQTQSSEGGPLADDSSQTPQSENKSSTNGSSTNGSKVKEPLYTFCGTPEYLSPEMLIHRQRATGYGFEIDWWGLGIVCYEMLVGYVPFFDRDFTRMCEKIMSRPVRFPSKFDIPKPAQSFVKGLLHRNPTKRLCCGFHRAGELKNIPFFAEMNWDSLERGLMAPPFLPTVSSKLPQDNQNFDKISTFNKIAIQKGEKPIEALMEEEKAEQKKVAMKLEGSSSASGGSSMSGIQTGNLMKDAASKLAAQIDSTGSIGMGIRDRSPTQDEFVDFDYVQLSHQSSFATEEGAARQPNVRLSHQSSFTSEDSANRQPNARLVHQSSFVSEDGANRQPNARLEKQSNFATEEAAAKQPNAVSSSSSLK